MMVRISMSRTAAMLLAASTAVAAGCQPPSDGLPSAAILHVESEEPAATSIRLRLVGADGDALEVLSISAGERVVTQHAALPGTYTLEARPLDCSLEVALIAGSETDVVFVNGAGRDCFEPAGSHTAGESPHPYFGALSLVLTGTGSRRPSVELVSLDRPPNPGGRNLEPDEAGRYFAQNLPQGRYEIRVQDADGLLATEAFEIGSGADASVNVVIDISGRD
jgi:hypothetical protein